MHVIDEAIEKVEKALSVLIISRKGLQFSINKGYFLYGKEVAYKEVLSMLKGEGSGMKQIRDFSYFEKIGKKESLKKLKEHEQAGTLLQFMKAVAPDYVTGTSIDKFTLIKDAGW